MKLPVWTFNGHGECITYYLEVCVSQPVLFWFQWDEVFGQASQLNQQRWARPAGLVVSLFVCVSVCVCLFTMCTMERFTALTHRSRCLIPLTEICKHVQRFPECFEKWEITGCNVAASQTCLRKMLRLCRKKKALSVRRGSCGYTGLCNMAELDHCNCSQKIHDLFLRQRPDLTLICHF